MGFVEMMIIFLMALILGLCTYRITDLSSKLNRIRGRYDLLLRGRGELNLEELLSAQAGDIEDLLYRMDDLENKDFSNKIESRLTNIEKIQNENDRRIHEKLEFSVDNLSKSIENSVKNVQAETNNTIRRLSEKHDNDLKDFQEKNEKFEEDLTAKTKRALRLISDQLAFSIQKVALKRYNALDNQSGELSFTIVMLDQLNNGVMLTSINGRDSSYTYSKFIKNGKSELECSPEEIEALNEALNKKEIKEEE